MFLPKMETFLYEPDAAILRYLQPILLFLSA